MPPDPAVELYGGREPQNACRNDDIERELQSFSYMVSHDLSASLRHVSEFSRLLVADLGETQTVRQKAYAERVRASAELCQTMMENLLTYSRVQQKELEKKRQEGATALRKPLLELAAQAQAAGARIDLGDLGEVYGDPALIGMALRHLVENAIKFRRPEQAPQITVEAAPDARFWRLRIADNGLGVDPPYREKVFQMFARLHGPDAYPGVGAGLAICRRIARRHGGEVAFLDCQDGACVELSLPHERTEP